MKKTIRVFGMSVILLLALSMTTCSDSGSDDGTALLLLSMRGSTPCTNHTAGAAATCTTAQTCILCDYEFAPALGHDWKYEDGANEPTCTTSGSGARYCIRDGCDETCDENYYPPLGHCFATIPATCTTDSIPGTCTRDGCDVENPETVIAALGHDFDWEMEGIKICKRDNCNANPAIGDTGPAGGIIFYIADGLDSRPLGFTVQGYSEGSGETEHLNFTEYFAHYLEAATENMATTLSWASWEFRTLDIPGTGSVLGTGRRNTALILELDRTAPAALACINYRVTGYESFTDWFLPSSTELSRLAQIRGQYGVPDSGWYWASNQTSPTSIDRAQVLSFGGSFMGIVKSEGQNVRAVRAF